jgi:hypothetical protein
VTALLSLLGALVPGATHCTSMALCEPTSLGFDVALTVEASGYDASARGNRCDFEGIGLDLGFRHPWVALEAGLAFWTIGRTDERANGIGDLRLSVDAAVARFDASRVAFGLGLSGTLPTGDVSLGTGASHGMLMPSFWLRYRPDGANLGLRVAGHLMLTSEDPGHAGHGVALVDPMNHWGVTVGLEGSLELHPYAWLTAGANVDIPTDDGRLYAAVSAGVRVPVDPIEFGVELVIPFAEDSRFIRGRVSVAARF